MHIDGRTNNGGLQVTIPPREQTLLYEALVSMRRIYEENPVFEEFTVDEIRTLELDFKPKEAS